MKFWEAIEKEEDGIKQEFHERALVERIWECKPLLVIDESDDSVAFEGESNVDVKPHEDGTADLVASANRDGWNPSLNNAVVKIFGARGLYSTSTSDGLVCRGTDAEGNHFTWYINGAADAYGEYTLAGFTPADHPHEEPEPEDQ